MANITHTESEKEKRLENENERTREKKFPSKEQSVMWNARQVKVLSGVHDVSVCFNIFLNCSVCASPILHHVHRRQHTHSLSYVWISRTIFFNARSKCNYNSFFRRIFFFRFCWFFLFGCFIAAVVLSNPLFLCALGKKRLCFCSLFHDDGWFLFFFLRYLCKSRQYCHCVLLNCRLPLFDLKVNRMRQKKHKT